MLRLIYSILLYLFTPILFLLLLKRGLKQKSYLKRISERFGLLKKLQAPKQGGVLIHAASVGEIIAAINLIKAIQKKYLNLAITITTITPTGSERVLKTFGSSVTHIYLPYDLPDAVNRFLDFCKPKVIILIETELWPNLIYQAYKRKIPFVIANARLSKRSAKRYALLKDSIKDLLNKFDLIMAQDSISAEHYLSLGVDKEKLDNTGNIKFDVAVDQSLKEQIIQAKQILNSSNRPVWIAGSTHEGEEKIILEAHRELLEKYPDLLLILVPRHPERFAEVYELIVNMNFRVLRKSDEPKVDDKTEVLLGDTMGEMLILYGVSDIAFIGGSLFAYGGHNPLEAIVFDLPIISGMHTFNFSQMYEKLKQSNALLEITNEPTTLAFAVSRLLEDKNLYKEMSSQGAKFLNANRGALARHLELLEPFLKD